MTAQGTDMTLPVAQTTRGRWLALQYGALLLACTLTLSALTGCGGVERKRGSSPAEELYLQGIDAQKDEDYLSATERFRNVKTKFVYTRYAALAELRLADVQFDQGRFVEAISLYQAFIQGRPNHRELPYATWRVAESYVKQRPSDFFLTPPSHERDRGPTRDALRAIGNYLSRFPDGAYVKEAKAYQVACRTTLAEYELYVARFYRAQGSLKASEGRYLVVVKAFEDVPELWREGAEELIALYQKQEKKDEASALTERLESFLTRPKAKP